MDGLYSWVLSPGWHPSSWHAIGWYFDAWRSAYKNCTMCQIICCRRPTHLEQLASRHSWSDTVRGNICNTVENLPVCLTAAAPVFLNWRLRNLHYDDDDDDISQLWFDYDKTTIRRYHDAFDYDGSDRNYDSTAIRLRSDYDVLRAPASIRRNSTREKNEHVNFSS